MTLQMEQRLKQTQRMMLSPQIRQAIELLYLTHMEIKDVVSDELTKNPVLEETDHETKSLSLDWRKPHRLSSSSTESTTGNRQNNLENIVEGNLFAQGKTLAEHLEWQLRMESLSPKQHRFALNIIYNLNDEGFLATPLTLLAQEHGVSRKRPSLFKNKFRNLIL